MECGDVSDPLYESSVKRLGELPVTQTPFGAFSSVIPVPVDEPGAPDWGDVHDNVMLLISLYAELAEVAGNPPGGRMVCTVVDLTRKIDDVEQRLGITWTEGMVPGQTYPDARGAAGAHPRRWNYRVC